METTEEGLSLGDIVLDGDPASPPLKGHNPQFLAPICRCGQTGEWTKVPLGTEVGLSPGDFVFDGDRAPPEKGHIPTQFWPMSIVAKRLDGRRRHFVRK